ncbi:12-oxophytodienoate reductase [Hoeflea sp. BAL378]|uniref:oxidoreductase n=1 Tax=Hoeflea sp. BAL378 TaxID=1547437 RepID=UPI0009E00074|nr:12-oxophytodienoate reductase [Hoeflea sp. BAL378]
MTDSAAQTPRHLDRAALGEPLTIRAVTIPNRIAMAPMTRGFSAGGIPTAASADYYARRARGGTGLIITEAVGVEHPSALGEAGQGIDEAPVLYGTKPLEGWRRVVEQVHAEGAKIVPQLWHQGVIRAPGTGPFPDAPTIGPSGVWGPLGTTSLESDKIPSNPVLGDPLTDEQIQDVIDAFVGAAANAVGVGFDGIAIHGAHGYLLDNFLWEGTNLRTDRWGGDRKRRNAVIVEILSGIRRVIGDRRPIIFRFSQWKLQDYRAELARTPSELEEILGPMAEAGVDMFDASVRFFDRPAFEGSDMNLAGWAKKLTGKLSMTVGGVGLNKGTFDDAGGLAAVDNIDKIMARFARGEFDMVAVGRALIGDPDWTRKMLDHTLPHPFHPRQLETLE